MKTAVRLGVHLACLTPLTLVLLAIYNGQAGPNPPEFFTESTGDWTLRFLLITLTVRPAAKIFRFPVLLSYRRAVGLYAFFYALVHFLTFSGFDHLFIWEEIVADIAKRPFIYVGFGSLLALIPLAVTSNKKAIRALGHKWKILHRLVYVIAISGMVHYWWQIRDDYEKAALYSLILMILLGYRVFAWWRLRRLYA